MPATDCPREVPKTLTPSEAARSISPGRCPTACSPESRPKSPDACRHCMPSSLLLFDRNSLPACAKRGVDNVGGPPKGSRFVPEAERLHQDWAVLLAELLKQSCQIRGDRLLFTLPRSNLRRPFFRRDAVVTTVCALPLIDVRRERASRNWLVCERRVVVEFVSRSSATDGGHAPLERAPCGWHQGKRRLPC